MFTIPAAVEMSVKEPTDTEFNCLLACGNGLSISRVHSFEVTQKALMYSVTDCSRSRELSRLSEEGYLAPVTGAGSLEFTVRAGA